MKLALQNLKEDTIATVGGIDDNDLAFALTTGNFANTSTGQRAVLLLDYDSSSKREYVWCTINGTSVTITARAKGGTSAQSHAQNAKVLMVFMTDHYDWLANMVQDGWVDAMETWTYASASTFTVAADVTGIMNVGDKIRLKQGGSYKYFFISAISYSNPNTTVTVKDGINAATYTLANATITDNYYSKVATPNGFPVNASFYDFCRVTKSADQSVNNETETTITWTSETHDTNLMHDTGSSPENITIRTAGKYTIDVFLLFDNDPDDITQRSFTILCNGNFIGGGLGVQTGADIDIPATGSVTYQFAANDVITVKAYHQAGNALNVLSARTMMSVAMIP